VHFEMTKREAYLLSTCQTTTWEIKQQVAEAPHVAGQKKMVMYLAWDFIAAFFCAARCMLIEMPVCLPQSWQKV